MASDNLVVVKDLCKSFFSGQTELRVLKGIGLEVNRGEMLGVVGASGAGKSTLLHLIGGLDKPDRGQIYIKGIDILGLSDRDLCGFRNKHVGFIFQFHHLLPEFSALENVMMPVLIRGESREGAKRRALELLEEVGLEGRVHHRPGELSGGEQQRVAVARALVNSPELILADEPTGNLDSVNSDTVNELLKRLNSARNQTFVVVTHNRDLALSLHRVVTLVDGRIEAPAGGE